MSIFNQQTMTSKQNTFTFLKAGTYNGITNDLYIEIVKYHQILDQPFLKKKNDNKNGTILNTCKDTMSPF